MRFYNGRSSLSKKTLKAVKESGNEANTSAEKNPEIELKQEKQKSITIV